MQRVEATVCAAGIEDKRSPCHVIFHFFFSKSCWSELIQLQKCELASFPLCLKERDQHIKCLSRFYAEIDLKMKERE